MFEYFLWKSISLSVFRPSSFTYYMKEYLFLTSAPEEKMFIAFSIKIILALLIGKKKRKWGERQKVLWEFERMCDLSNLLTISLATLRSRAQSRDYHPPPSNIINGLSVYVPPKPRFLSSLSIYSSPTSWAIHLPLSR